MKHVLPAGHGLRFDRLGRLALLLLAAVVVSAPAWAIDRQAPFDNPALEQRYQKLIHEIRCLECLDESIADSNAELAAQFRRQIHIQVADGKSEKEIIDFLVARYGDFVIYRPPFQPNTWLLWGAPFILLAIGGVVFARILRNRAAQPLDEDTIT